MLNNAYLTIYNAKVTMYVKKAQVKITIELSPVISIFFQGLLKCATSALWPYGKI